MWVLLLLDARRDHVLTQTFVFLREGGTFPHVLTLLAAPPCHIYTRLSVEESVAWKKIYKQTVSTVIIVKSRMQVLLTF